MQTFIRAQRHTLTNILSSKWVMRWKLIDNIKQVKARLTARGFQDAEAGQLQTYASTASRWGQRIITCFAAQNKWKLTTLDVSAAFLQGLTFAQLAKLNNEPERKVAFEPPKGYEQFFRELDGCSDLDFNRETLLMLKPIYGLVDAPRAWRQRLDIAFTQLGGRALKTDKAIYVFRKNNDLRGIISAHVDDLKMYWHFRPA